MFAEYFRSSPWVDLANVSGIFFALFFTGVVAWVLIDPKGTFDRASRLPLERDDATEEKR